MKTLRVTLNHLRRGCPRPRHAALGRQRAGFSLHGWFVAFGSLTTFPADVARAQRRSEVIPVWPL